MRLVWSSSITILQADLTVAFMLGATFSSSCVYTDVWLDTAEVCIISRPSVNNLLMVN